MEGLRHLVTKPEALDPLDRSFRGGRGVLRRRHQPRPGARLSKTFSLRGLKDSPPYFHDGRLPTLEDVVEFFNVVFQTKLTAARSGIWWRF